MDTISSVKAYLRKRRVCAQRGRAGRMQPLRLTNKALAKARQDYIDRVDALAEQIRAFRPREELPGQKRPFTGYQIASYNGDQMGKVLKKDGRIFRGIYAESAGWFQKLWDQGLIQVLAQAGLVPRTTVTDYQTDRFPIILEHQAVEISTAKLWNPEMVRDACITICVVDSVCRRFGYKLIDGHLNNVTFVAGKPVFTDIGSIVEDRGQYTSYASSLLFAGGYKLIAAALGNCILERIQLFDEDNNAIWPSPLHYDEATRECRYLLGRFRRWHRWHSTPVANGIIFRLFELGQIRPEYFALIFPDRPLPELPEEDYGLLVEAVGPLEVRSATVVGGPVSLGQQLHDRWGLRTVVLDHSVEGACRSYRGARDLSCYCYDYLYGGDSASLRCIRTELAVAWDVTENLISYQNFKLDSLFNGLRKLTDRYVAVSFRPGRAAARCVDEAADSPEGFGQVFSSFFHPIAVTEEDGRWIFVGERLEDTIC